MEGAPDAPGVKDCCKDGRNLRQETSDLPDTTMRRCQICGCRHFDVVAETGRMGVEGSRVG